MCMCAHALLQLSVLCPRCFPDSQEKGVPASIFSFQVLGFSSFPRFLLLQSRAVIIMTVIFKIVPKNLVLMHYYCKHISQARCNSLLLREKHPGRACI